MHFDKTCTEPAEVSVTALWGIIAKNKLIELTESKSTDLFAIIIIDKDFDQMR